MIQLTENILRKVVNKRKENSHKGTFGRAVLIGGNHQYGGAIIMSAEACINSGAGLTTVVTDKKNHTALHTRLPEAMALDFSEKELIHSVLDSADVILIGPGLGLEKESEVLFDLVLANQTKDQWLIIDGSAITMFAESDRTLPYPEQTVFTPHQAEWARISGFSISEQTTYENERAQARLGAKVVLKSHRTMLYDHGTARYQNTAGNPGMATGGMGDTLAGLITGFLAQFTPNLETIGAAVYLHSLIGDELFEESYVVLPTRISHELPRYMKIYAE